MPRSTRFTIRATPTDMAALNSIAAGLRATGHPAAGRTTALRHALATTRALMGKLASATPATAPAQAPL